MKSSSTSASCSLTFAARHCGSVSCVTDPMYFSSILRLWLPIEAWMCDQRPEMDQVRQQESKECVGDPDRGWLDRPPRPSGPLGRLSGSSGSLLCPRPGDLSECGVSWPPEIHITSPSRSHHATCRQYDLHANRGVEEPLALRQRCQPEPGGRSRRGSPGEGDERPAGVSRGTRRSARRRRPLSGTREIHLTKKCLPLSSNPRT